MKRKEKDYQNFGWLDMFKPTKEELENLEIPFKIDSKYIDDVLEKGHLPKKEEAKGYTFLLLRAYDDDNPGITRNSQDLTHKLAFFRGEDFLLTVHNSDFPFLEKARLMDFDSCDDLFLFLINEVLETYEIPLEIQGNKMDRMEEEVFVGNCDNLSIESLYYEKSNARWIKKVLMITDGVIEHLRVKPELESTLQDIKDSATEFLLEADEVMDDANNILNSFMTVNSQKSNDVMKLLTIFSAFFLPLSFIAGLYGMNFVNMPELQNPNGYFITLFVMVIICIGIYFWFKKKGIL